MLSNEGKPTPMPGELLRLALREPSGFVVYAAVSLAVRSKKSAAQWTRGR
jgi:hypothetical protein